MSKDKYLFFIAEKLEDTAENKEERRKRKIFFHRNKFIETGYEYESNGVTFESYSKGVIPLEDSIRYCKTIKEIYYSE